MSVTIIVARFSLPAFADHATLQFRRINWLRAIIHDRLWLEQIAT